MQPTVRTLTLKKDYPTEFCICTITTNLTEYENMKNSFTEKGFENNCTFLIADNSNGNIYNPYYAIKRFLQESNAKYTLVVHQDVRCIDTIEILKHRLTELDNMDNKWGICGNAGAIDYKQMVYFLKNIDEVKITKGLPVKVFSLDENFLIFKTEASVGISSNINSFHLYGTDICLHADMQGYSCYVIPFMINHLSKGNLKDLKNYTSEFINLYGYKLRSRFVQTTCTKFYLGKSVLRNKIYNSSFFFFGIKAFRRLAISIKPK